MLTEGQWSGHEVRLKLDNYFHASPFPFPAAQNGFNTFWRSAQSQGLLVGQVIGYVGHLFPPFSSDPLIKSFHFWPLLASHRILWHQYQKSELSWASFHISILFSIVSRCEKFMRPKLVIIFAIREFHCSSLSFFVPRFLASFEGGEEEREEEREKSADAEKRSCHLRKPVWALCKCSTICEYGWWFVKWLAYTVSLVSFQIHALLYYSVNLKLIIY